jgi:hypothetical protein
MGENSGWVGQYAIEWEAVVVSVDGFDTGGGGVEEVLSAQLHWDAWGIGGGWAFVCGRKTESVREGAGRRGLGAGWEGWWWAVVVVVSVGLSDCFEVAITLLFA